jgi:hypothetical protein
MSAPINQYEQTCDNKCGSVLHEHAIIYILTPPKGEDQAWCEDCKTWNWDHLKTNGWTCDDEESSDEESSDEEYDCEAVGCTDDNCADGCKCECTDCQRNRPTDEEETAEEMKARGAMNGDGFVICDTCSICAKDATDGGVIAADGQHHWACKQCVKNAAA